MKAVISILFKGDVCIKTLELSALVEASFFPHKLIPDKYRGLFKVRQYWKSWN